MGNYLLSDSLWSFLKLFSADAWNFLRWLTCWLELTEGIILPHTVSEAGVRRGFKDRSRNPSQHTDNRDGDWNSPSAFSSFPAFSIEDPNSFQNHLRCSNMWLVLGFSSDIKMWCIDNTRIQFRVRPCLSSSVYLMCDTRREIISSSWTVVEPRQFCETGFNFLSPILTAVPHGFVVILFLTLFVFLGVLLFRILLILFFICVLVVVPAVER